MRETATGRVLRVTKGAPQVVLAMAHNQAEIRERVLGAQRAAHLRGERAMRARMPAREQRQHSDARARVLR